jgi:ABC-type branched-subunit amino acid transport system substrate-binding protein
MIAKHGRKSLVVLIAAGALALAACSSSGNTSSGGASGNTSSGGAGSTATSANVQPIKIGVIEPINSAILSTKDVYAAQQVAVDSVNAAGGVNGRPLKLILCDDQNDPGTAAICAQTLLDNDKVLCLVGGTSIVTSAIYPALAAAGTINFGEEPTTAVDLQNALSYPIDLGSAAAALPAAAFPSSVRKVAVVSPAGAAGDLVRSITGPLLKARGITEVDVEYTTGAAQYPSLALKVKTTGAGGVLMATGSADIGPLYQALVQQGLGGLKIYTSDGYFTDQLIQELTALKAQLTFQANFVVDPQFSPLLARWRSDTQKYKSVLSAAGVSIYKQTVVNGYAAVILLAQTLEKLPNISASALKAYLNSQTSFSTDGLTHPLDFAQSPGTTFPRAFNHWISRATVQNGQPYQSSVTWVNVQL